MEFICREVDIEMQDQLFFPQPLAVEALHNPSHGHFKGVSLGDMKSLFLFADGNASASGHIHQEGLSFSFLRLIGNV